MYVNQVIYSINKDAIIINLIFILKVLFYNDDEKQKIDRWHL